MKSINFRNCLILILIPFTPCLNAQVDLSEDTYSGPSDQLCRHMLNRPNENFVVQTDRDMYFAGTELRFSVWSLDDHTLCPFSYSGIVNIELMDKEGNSVDQKILKLENHKSSGRIFIPDQLSSGTYYLRAYSNLQRNFGEHLFGIKIIQVINPSKPPGGQLPGQTDKPVISVYPEGQRLLQGIFNKLVIKAIYPNGRYAELSEGYLVRHPDDTIGQLRFPMPGMGFCSFYADSSYTYYLDLPGSGRIPLEIMNKGLTLRLQEEENQLRLKLLGKGIADIEHHCLIGKTRGQVFYTRVLEPGLGQVVIPCSTLPGGLLQFSILDSCYNEYCQRLYYHEKVQELVTSDLIFEKSSVKRGETINMEIVHPQEKEFAFLSLSIRKDLFIHHTLNQSFRSCVDLHPFLNDWDEFGQLVPAIPADSFPGILDLYLITRESSRFKWQDINQGIPEKLDFLPEVNSKRITGICFNPEMGRRISNTRLALFFVGKEASILSSCTDSLGRFSFEYPASKTGMSELVIQSFGLNNPMEISFDWPFHQSSHPYQLDYFHFDSSRFNDYDKAYVYSLLEKMYHSRDKSVRKTDERIPAFYGIPDSRKRLGDFVSMISMEEVFKEIIPGDKIGVRNGEYNIAIYHREKYVLLGDNPLVLFNGVPIEHFGEILGLPVNGVDFVDMVRQSYRIQDRVFDGIINIVTKDLDLQLAIPSNAFKTSLEVFSPSCRFDWVQECPGPVIPNLNPTLYWNPDLSFSGTKRHISFAAGDNPGRYQAVLRGIDTDGKILEIIKYIFIE